MSLGGEQELLFNLASERGRDQRKPYMQNFAGRMWSGGTREHYASEISCHKQKSSNCPHHSKIKGFNNQWDFKKCQLTLI